MAKEKLSDIRKSLLKQLSDSGAEVEHFVSLVDDYIYYEQQERKMQADVRKRGLTYTTVNAQCVEVEKENPSVKSAYMYNKQKLAILKEMGLTTKSVMSEQDDEL